MKSTGEDPPAPYLQDGFGALVPQIGVLFWSFGTGGPIAAPSRRAVRDRQRLDVTCRAAT